MRKMLGQIKTGFFLVAATLVAIYLASKYEYLLLRLSSSLGGPRIAIDWWKYIATLLMPFLYIIGQTITGLLDKKSMFIGTYLSLPSDRDQFNVFKIAFNRLDGNYNLAGNSYSLSSGIKIGHWNSSTLDMRTANPAMLLYTYEGKIRGVPVTGHVYIEFKGKKPEKSDDGYFVDVKVIEGTKGRTDWKRSNYVKVTPEIKRLIFKKTFWRDWRIRRYVNDIETIFKEYLKNRVELENLTSGEFARPEEN